MSPHSGGLYSLFTIAVYAETVYFNKLFQQKCYKSHRIFLKVLLINTIFLFLLLFSKNNFKFNIIEDLQRIHNSNFLLKIKRIPKIWRTIILGLLTLLEGEGNLAYMKKTHYHTTFLKKKILTKSMGTWFIHFPVSSNSTDEKLKSKIDQAEKHLDSKRDPRLSSAVAICLTLSSENAIMRGNPRSPEFSGILQGKVSPILSCFKTFFSLLKKKE